MIEVMKQNVDNGWKLNRISAEYNIVPLGGGDWHITVEPMK